MRRRSARGLTLVEVVVATSIAVSLLVAALSLTDSTGTAASAAHVRASIFIRASRASERLVRELQTSSLVGEDVNKNGTLDGNEDTNANGRLDADWSLSDETSAGEITFNRVRRDWTWTGPISYRLVDGNLVRSEDGVEEVVCRDVDEFSLRRSVSQILLKLRAFARDRKSRTWNETVERICHVRN